MRSTKQIWIFKVGPVALGLFALPVSHAATISSQATATGSPATKLPTKTLLQLEGTPKKRSLAKTKTLKSSSTAAASSSLTLTESPSALRSDRASLADPALAQAPAPLPAPAPAPTPIVDSDAEPTSSTTTRALTTSSYAAVTQAPEFYSPPSAPSPSPTVVARPAPHARPFEDSWREAWFHLDLGLTYSKWNKLSPSMRKGTVVTGFRLSRMMDPNIEMSLGLESLNGANSYHAKENIRSGYQLTGSSRVFLGDGLFRPFAGLGLSLGSYRAWTITNESGSSITYDKIANGTLAGLSPQIGMSLGLAPNFRADVTARYQYYFGKRARSVGGWGVLGSLGFAF